MGITPVRLPRMVVVQRKLWGTYSIGLSNVTEARAPGPPKSWKSTVFFKFSCKGNWDHHNSGDQLPNCTTLPWRIHRCVQIHCTDGGGKMRSPTRLSTDSTEHRTKLLLQGPRRNWLLTSRDHLAEDLLTIKSSIKSQHKRQST